MQTLWKCPARDTALARHTLALAEIKAPPATYDEIRLIEARAASAYFSAWQDYPLRWKGIGRKPIRPDWHRCGTRQGLIGDRNRYATHPVNALLNYGYALLESEMRIALVAAGLDPEVGFLHVNRPGRLSLVYDAMEPLRPVVDRMVLDFIPHTTFAPGDFKLNEKGVRKLNPQMARRFLQRLILQRACEGPISLLVEGLG